MPSNLIEYTQINEDGYTYGSVSDYQTRSYITFGPGKKYTDAEGIITFRGNNYRDTAAYGYAEMSEYKIKTLWTHATGGLTYGNASWTGSGWTGQPLIVKWPESTKKVMNMYDSARQKEDLVEVIYACMDGYVYFLDLETGEKTRDSLYLGYTFKGAGALDPRGYPIMYLGSGYDSNQGTSRAFIINLLDCSVMYTFGNLYLIRLNTDYDEKAGTLSIDPGPVVKWRYSGTRTSVGSYWLGMEDSAVIYGEYIYMTDNGGNFMCLNLNTMQLAWVQDVLDDSNATSVLAVENGHPYLYVSTSFHLGWRSNSTATVPVWKIDGETGEIIWHTDYTCYSESGVSGGVQSTIAVGQHDLSDYMYVTVSRTGGMYDGVLACLERKTGDIVWEHEAYYTWSSPVCVYNSDGSGKVFYGTGAGKVYLLDGKTGETLDSLEIGGSMIEASPAVYGNKVVLGIRDCRIYGLELT